MTTHDDQISTVAELMRATDIAVLTYVSLDGALVSTPMATRDFTDPGTMWFLTERDTDKVRAIQADPRVNVTYHGDNGWVSLSGTATVSDDRAKVAELWDASADTWMSGGPEDAANVALRVEGATAEYWESPGKATAAVQLVKGLVSNSRPDMGDNDTVEL
ncbi:pyridoxamine 5'-phosphate oxidase family protein [Nocardioides xinjiangensis]|uniref:pyridoxamine 5'-phosphate oxidase family protein n=1 Tax=Nocardioides xinjiangensis TaxID=2817376 RepID=UPI001B30E58A|nr:pyridoxamine 5'-phosphate oxidase family protein [Nocardioides sp. SYSU D00778]